MDRTTSYSCLCPVGSKRDLTSADGEYTRVVVEKEPEPTEFRIFWLVPGEAYDVQIEVDETLIYEEFVPSLPNI